MVGFIAVMIDLLPEDKKLKGKEKNEVPVIPANGLNRTPAQLGVRDLSKLQLAFQTLKSVKTEDRGGQTYYIPLRNAEKKFELGSGAKFEYTSIREFNWNDREHIRLLNSWREQLLRRHFGQKRETRNFWTEVERGWVLGLLEEMLRQRSTIDFIGLANKYNARYYGQTQPAGIRMVKNGKRHEGSWTIQPRRTPWRSSSAILGQSKKWPEWKALENLACKWRTKMTAEEVAANNKKYEKVESKNPNAAEEELAEDEDDDDEESADDLEENSDEE